MPQHRFQIKAAGDSATIYVYEEIGYWGVTAKDFADQIAGLSSAKQINVRINSPGGDVFDGLAMYNLLRGHGADVTVDVDGWAASAASIVAMAGDTIQMASNSFLLIHAPWTIAMGNADDLRKTVDQLEAIETKLVDTYADRRSISRDTVAGWVSEETMFSADEAVDAGLADSVTSESAIAASADYSRFRFLPEAMRQRVRVGPQPVENQDVISIAAARRQRQLTISRNRG